MSSVGQRANCMGEPDLEQARRTSGVAHEVVVKLKEMGIPPGLDDELASLSTDLGDLWSAEKRLSKDLEQFLRSPADWESIGNTLVDLKATINHIEWHLKCVRAPLNKIVRFAYKQGMANKLEHSGD